MSDTIQLRIVGFNKNGIFQFICLETDIAISAETHADAKNKMRDALTSYFQSFSKAELESGAFIRKAPMRYRVGWYLLSVTGFIKTFFFSSQADYDLHSHEVRFA